MDLNESKALYGSLNPSQSCVYFKYLIGTYNADKISDRLEITDFPDRKQMCFAVAGCTDLHLHMHGANRISGQQFLQKVQKDPL